VRDAHRRANDAWQCNPTTKPRNHEAENSNPRDAATPARVAEAAREVQVASAAIEARFIARSAEEFAREDFGHKGGGKFPRNFDSDTEPRSLDQVKSLGVLRRFRLTTHRPELKAALASQAPDGRAWRRPIHRALCGPPLLFRWR
jgi:hypothetical protein